MFSSASSPPSPEQIGWLQRSVHAAMKMQAYGEALARVPLLFFADVEPAKNRESAAHFLALAVNQNGGSLEGTWDALRLWGQRVGRLPAISDHQVTTLLKDREPSIRELEAWMADVLRGLWDLNVAEHKSRVFTVLEIDENQRAFQGRGAKAFMTPAQYRKKSTTLAGKTATALKPGRSYATGIGHEYLVMSETVYPAKATMALRTALRDAVSYDKSTEVSNMLDYRETFSQYPDFAMLDAGFCTYQILARLVKFCRRAKNLGKKATKFWMPAIKSKSQKQDLNLNELSDDALNGVYDVIMREWNRQPQHVEGTGLYFACVERDIKDSGGLKCNLVIFYRIRESAWKRRPTELRFDKDVRITAFFTNEKVTVENAEECAKVYSMRWNAENLYQKLGKILGILPSKDIYKRVLSYGLGMTSMSVYALQRIWDYEALRATSEDEEVELTRQRSFFDVAKRDLQAMLDAT